MELIYYIRSCVRYAEMILCGSVHDGFCPLPAKKRACRYDENTFEGRPGSGNETVAEQCIKGCKMELPRNTDGKERFDFASKEQVALCRPIGNVVECMGSRKWTTIDHRSTIRNPV